MFRASSGMVRKNTRLVLEEARENYLRLSLKRLEKYYL